MPQTVNQSVSVTPTNSPAVTILLDGNRADILAGGADGTAGTLRLLDATARERILANSPSGTVQLRDDAGVTRIELTAQPLRIRLRAADGTILAELGPNGNLKLGGGGEDGDLDLHDPDGRRRVLLGAGQTSLDFFDSAGRQVCAYGRNSNLRLGGHGTDGDILLFPKGASDIFVNSQASIHLDADAGEITLRNADCAEEFDVVPAVDAEPGMLMALAEDGRLRPSSRAYETGVVGVVSGAGTFRPGLVLDRRPGVLGRRPIAMVGKTYVRVTGQGGPVRAGDLMAASGRSV